MENYLWCNLVCEMESSEIIYEMNLFCNRLNLFHNNKNRRNEEIVP